MNNTVEMTFWISQGKVTTVYEVEKAGGGKTSAALARARAGHRANVLHPVVC